MPRWIRAAFFDPETTRKRLSDHDYYASSSEAERRKIKDCRLIDELELPLKSIHNFQFAAFHAIELGLGQYLEEMLSPFQETGPHNFI